MKSFILIALLFISSIAYTYPVTTIVGSSFSESQPIKSGTEQWIDFTYDGGGIATGDKLIIVIYHMEGTTQSNFFKIDKGSYINYVSETPAKTDSIRRVYFTMPSNYVQGKFSANINLNGRTIYGQINDNIAGITLLDLKEQDFKVDIYTINGVFVKSGSSKNIEENLNSGFYIFTAESRDKKYSGKFLIN